MRHTPAPWICSEDNFGNPVVTTPGKFGPLGYLIAEVSSAQDNPHTKESKEEAQANARLISQAPTLIELVEEAFERFTDNDMQPPNEKLRNWLDRASKVLAKVEARQ